MKQQLTFYRLQVKLVQQLKTMGPLSSKSKQQPIKPQPQMTYQNMVKIISQYPIEKQYKFLDLLGKGTYAQVYKAESLQTQNIRAIKKIDRKGNNKIEQMLINQFDILKQCDHPNIIKMYQLFQDYKYFYIVSQLCQGTELYEAIKQSKNFSENQACQIFYQIVSGVAYLHHLKIMHRDIKPENMMFDPKSKMIKLIDFGTAVRFQNDQLLNRRCVGTAYYVAPQVLQKKYNQKCDIWSLGVILYILLCGKPPFGGKTDDQIMKKIISAEITFTDPVWENVSPQAKKLIKRMLTKSPKDRISAKQLMNEEWFKFHLKNQLLPSQIPYMVKCLKNMKKFQQMKATKIQQGMLIFIISFIKNSEDDVILWKCFKKLDVNGDGSLNRAQLKAGFQQYLNMPQKQAENFSKAVFDKVDFNKSDSIDYSQFIIAAIDIELAVTDKNLQIAFDYIDTDKSGTLDVHQIRSKLGENIQQQTYQKLIKEFDSNSDGEIDKKQFKQMMKKLINSKEK